MSSWGIVGNRVSKRRMVEAAWMDMKGRLLLRSTLDVGERRKHKDTATRRKNQTIQNVESLPKIIKGRAPGIALVGSL